MSSDPSISKPPTGRTSSTHLPQDETITLKVGPKKTPFYVSKALLASKSKYFDRCLNGGFAETRQKEFFLPDIYCAIFEIVLTWINTGLLEHEPDEDEFRDLLGDLDAEIQERITAQIPEKKVLATQLMQDSPLQKDSDAWRKSYGDTFDQLVVTDAQWEEKKAQLFPGLEPWEWSDYPCPYKNSQKEWADDEADSWSWRCLIRLYLFSDFYDMHELGNAVIDAMEKRLLRQQHIPLASDICLIYDQTPQDSALQRFVVNYLAATVDWSRLGEEHGLGEEEDAKYRDFLASCPHAFAISMIKRKDEYVKVPNGIGSKLHPPCVRRKTGFEICAYHRHETEEERKECSARSIPWWEETAKDRLKRKHEENEKVLAPTPALSRPLKRAVRR
ncbi:hypothetical protein MBLNU457_5760t1 [Dothideomycetes sp. NU457]